MTTPAAPPPACPWKPGDLTVTASPRWGHARIQDAAGHSLTILSSCQRHADAAADMLAGYAALLAERDATAALLESTARTLIDVTAERDRHRAAMRLGPDPAEVAADFFAGVEAGELAARTGATA